MLNHDLKQQLTTLLGQLPGNVGLEVVLPAEQNSAAQELLELAETLVTLSGKLSLQVTTAPANEQRRTPSLLVRNPQRGTHIEFAGVPTGHEFTSLVLALLHSGGQTPKIDPSQLAQIQALEGKHHFDIYVSLTCQTCPDVVQALNTIAALNPDITTTMIDGALFQDEIARHNILAVPTVLLDGKVFSQGRIALGDLLRKLDSRTEHAATAALDSKAPFDLLVVGAGPAGASAAIYAARKGIRTGLVAETFGGQVLDTVGIENFISVKATEGPRLVASLEEHVREYPVDIMSGQRAARIQARDEHGLFSVQLASGAILQSRSVVVATGARWRQLNVPGENEYKGRGVAYCPHCDGPLFKGKAVAVVGGGNSGIEAAIDLAGIAGHVTVLEFASSLKADSVLISKARSLANVTIVTNAQTLAVQGDGSKVNGLHYRNRETGGEHLILLDGIFVQIGLLPNSDPVKELVDVNKLGEIVVNRKGETSVPGVFAAGDVSDVAFKQIIIAMGSGANAALGAFEYLIRHNQAELQSQAA
jgi:alkyl hydroperoxide reductase subunit F